MTRPQPDADTPSSAPAARVCRDTAADPDVPGTPLAPDPSQWRPYVDWQHEIVVAGAVVVALGVVTALLIAMGGWL